jgi:hypothetical protein
MKCVPMINCYCIDAPGGRRVRQTQRAALGASHVAAHTKPDTTRQSKNRTLSDMQLKPYLPSTLARSMTSNHLCTG